jgi:hypothetical protein
VTDLKIDGKPNAGSTSALEPHITRLYDKPGLSIMAVVEFRHDQRTQVAAGSDKKQSVTVKIIGCEVANPEQEGALREAQRALYLQRTAAGTIDEDGAVTLNDDTIRRTGGLLTAIEVARLRAGLLSWTAYTRQVVGTAHNFSATEIAHELQAIADGLTAVLTTAALPIGDDDA